MPSSSLQRGYIPIPTSAVPIPNPPLTSLPEPPSAPKPPTQTARAAFPPNIPSSQHASGTSGSSASASASAAARIFGGGPAGGAISGVSDLLLSSLLPPNLPKLANQAAGAGGTAAVGGDGGEATKGGGVVGMDTGQGGVRGNVRVRELSTQRESLRLDVMSNNFRRFVTKVGPVFWLQDRIEEVLFWRKPIWTWAFLMAWTFISFNPRLLLLTPSAALLLILLHVSETRHPVPSVLGTLNPAPSAGTVRMSGTADRAATANAGVGSNAGGRTGGGIAAGGGAATVTTGPDGEVGAVVPPKEAESGVDYYMNLQAIQNTMGWVSDAYDEVYPILNSLSQPHKTPTQLPLTLTHLLLILLPPTLLLPLVPTDFLPLLILPLGWLPPLYFHPRLHPLVYALPSHPLIRAARARAAGAMMTDSLSDDVGRREIRRVEVWENERLDPGVTIKSHPPNAPLPPTSWGHRYLRAGERMPWVKILDSGSLWAEADTARSAGMDDSAGISVGNGSRNGEAGGGGREAAAGKDEARGGDKGKVELKAGWSWVPGEEWMVDVSGMWSQSGVDSEGWVYCDDSWQTCRPASVTIFAGSGTASSGTQIVATGVASSGSLFATNCGSMSLSDGAAYGILLGGGVATAVGTQAFIDVRPSDKPAYIPYASGAYILASGPGSVTVSLATGAADGYEFLYQFDRGYMSVSTATDISDIEVFQATARFDTIRGGTLAAGDTLDLTISTMSGATFYVQQDPITLVVSQATSMGMFMSGGTGTATILSGLSNTYTLTGSYYPAGRNYPESPPNAPNLQALNEAGAVATLNNATATISGVNNVVTFQNLARGSLGGSGGQAYVSSGASVTVGQSAGALVSASGAVFVRSNADSVSNGVFILGNGLATLELGAYVTAASAAPAATLTVTNPATVIRKLADAGEGNAIYTAVAYSPGAGARRRRSMPMATQGLCALGKTVCPAPAYRKGYECADLQNDLTIQHADQQTVAGAPTTAPPTRMEKSLA